MTHAINYNTYWHKSLSNASFLSLDFIRRTHTQMRKKRRERERAKNEESDRKGKNNEIKNENKIIKNNKN